MNHRYDHATIKDVSKNVQQMRSSSITEEEASQLKSEMERTGTAQKIATKSDRNIKLTANKLQNYMNSLASIEQLDTCNKSVDYAEQADSRQKLRGPNSLSRGGWNAQKFNIPTADNNDTASKVASTRYTN